MGFTQLTLWCLDDSPTGAAWLWLHPFLTQAFGLVPCGGGSRHLGVPGCVEGTALLGEQAALLCHCVMTCCCMVAHLRGCLVLSLQTAMAKQVRPAHNAHHGCTVQLVFQRYCEVDGVAGMILLVHIDQAVLLYATGTQSFIRTIGTCTHICCAACSV